MKGQLISKDEYNFFKLADDYIRLENNINNASNIPDKIILYKNYKNEFGLKWNKHFDKKINNLHYTGYSYIEEKLDSHQVGGSYKFDTVNRNKIILNTSVAKKDQNKCLSQAIKTTKKEINKYKKLDKKYRKYLNEKADIIIKEGEMGLIKPNNLSGNVFSRLVTKNHDDINITTGIYGAHYNSPDYIKLVNSNFKISLYPVVKANNEKEALNKAKKVAGGDGDIENLSINNLIDDIYQISYTVFD